MQRFHWCSPLVVLSCKVPLHYNEPLKYGHLYNEDIHVQWNPFTPDTIGTTVSILISGVSLFQGLILYTFVCICGKTKCPNLRVSGVRGFTVHVHVRPGFHMCLKCLRPRHNRASTVWDMSQTCLRHIWKPGLMAYSGTSIF